MLKKVFEVKNESELAAPAEYVKEYLQNGGVVLLKGDLGYGKTAFVRSFCSLFGCDGDVSSPTYTIMNEYKSEPKIFHYDFYNAGADSFFSKLMFEYLEEGGYHLMEWADEKIERFLVKNAIDTFRIDITKNPDESRTYEIYDA